MYENCTLVKRNLEIVHFHPADDLSFLENVREVRGYVLVASNLVSRVPLTSLRVIRGDRLFSAPPRSYALYVFDNTLNSSVGLPDLQMPSLMGK